MIRLATVACVLAFAFAPPTHAQTDEDIASRLTPAVHACERAPENGGTFLQAICYRNEVSRQDKILNGLWSSVIARSNAAERKVLRRGERQWIKDRDAECRKEAAEYINSTAAYMFNVCMANETIRRTLWLEKIRTPSS